MYPEFEPIVNDYVKFNIAFNFRGIIGKNVKRKTNNSFYSYPFHVTPYNTNIYGSVKLSAVSEI